RELQNDCLDALVASPAPAGAVFLGKAFANYALLLAVEIISLGVFSVFYDVHIGGKLGPLLLVMLLATWGMVVIGTMFSALTWNLYKVFYVLPVEANVGGYKIFYFHVPAAFTALGGFLTALVGSGLYLATGKFKYDGFAAAVTEVALAFATVNLVTGSIWARF